MNFYTKLAVTTFGAALLTTVGGVRATAAVFNFSYVGSPSTSTPNTPSADANVSGVLTTDPYDPATNSYRITGISGTRSTSNGTTTPIDSLLPTNSFLANDNLLLASSPQLDESGFSYQAGGQLYNVFHSYDNFEIGTTNPSGAPPYVGGRLSSFSATPAAVPEQSSALGLLGKSSGGSLSSFSATPAAVPEPSSVLSLLGMSVLTGGMLKQKLKQKKPTRPSL
jgi:hypothetical protein